MLSRFLHKIYNSNLDRKLRSIRSIPRFQKSYFDILGVKFEFIDSASFFFQFREIFQKEIYRFDSKKKEPFIIDCGANIGLSVIYFKKLYQASRILAFEPDPDIFLVLERNVAKYQCRNVELFNKAIWIEDATLKFIPDNSDGGRISLRNENKKKYISVSAVPLSKFLYEDVDLLKIDIEGAEVPVLQACENTLNHVENIFIEYHSFVNEKQKINQLLNILSEAGFRIYINPVNFIDQRFIRNKIISGMDMQLNIFGIRQL